MVAASTVVDVASVDIGDMPMDLWEPFRMYLVLKEVSYPPCPAPQSTGTFNGDGPLSAACLVMRHGWI